MKKIRVIHRKLGEMEGWLVKRVGQRCLITLTGIEQEMWVDARYLSEPEEEHGLVGTAARREQPNALPRRRRRPGKTHHQRAL